MYQRWILRGIIAGVVTMSVGSWLLWRGITNNIHRELFGDPLMPRWMWITSGLVFAMAGMGVIAFVLWQWQMASSRQDVRQDTEPSGANDVLLKIVTIRARLFRF
jgi:hypothetical protein